jgi:hypothetical protein
MPTFSNIPKKIEVPKEGNVAEFVAGFSNIVQQHRLSLSNKALYTLSLFTAYGDIGEHLYYLLIAMEKGFDCDEWNEYCAKIIQKAKTPTPNISATNGSSNTSASNVASNSSANNAAPDSTTTNVSPASNTSGTTSSSAAPSAPTINITREEREHMFVIAQDFVFKLWLTLKPDLGGDYVHIFFSHIFALMKKHGGLGQYSNQSVEHNHSSENKVYTSKISHGARPRRKKGERASIHPLSLANRQTKQMLEVILCVYVLRAIVLLQQIAVAEPYSTEQATLIRSYYTLCGWDTKSFPINPGNPEYNKVVEGAEKLMEQWFYISKINNDSCYKTVKKNLVFNPLFAANAGSASAPNPNTTTAEEDEEEEEEEEEDKEDEDEEEEEDKEEENDD